MNYLYGDSTASTLKSNFLEFLRDAIDFSVFVLQADTRVKQGHAQIRTLEEESARESARLERFIESVTNAVHVGEKGASDSPTARCGERLEALIAESHRASLEGIRQDLADATARIEADEAAARHACVEALGRLLAPHVPPDATTITRLLLRETGSYDASVEGKAEPALSWTLEIDVPPDHLFSSPLRIEQVVGPVEIRAPQITGWISKEVKVKPQRIERHVVTEFVDTMDRVSVKLRVEPTSNVGFDFTLDPEEETVRAKRVAEADDQSAGPFDLQVEDVPLVVQLIQKLRESVAELERKPNIEATFEETEFSALPTYVDFVERLVAMMAPIVREISQRSLTPNELVLRRLLSNDRREEIFVAKATLRDKLTALPPTLRELFTPLGLDVVDKTKIHEASGPPPAIRSELPPSVPPPPLPRGITPAKVPVVSTGKSTPPPPSPPVSRTIKPPSAVPPPKNPPEESSASGSDAPQLEVLDESEMTSEALFEPMSESSRSLASKINSELRNETLVATLKKILKLSKNGRAGDAYQEYANLFSSDAFKSYRPEEQRQALKLMVLAKSHPADKKDAVVSAHKAALVRIRALIDGANEPVPADQELLGVAHLYLGDTKAASAAFQAGLDIERARNPQSELIATLMRRVSQL